MTHAPAATLDDHTPIVLPTTFDVIRAADDGPCDITDCRTIRLWTSVLGPTAMATAYRFGCHLADFPDNNLRFQFDILAQSLGVAPMVLWKSIGRLDRFRVAVLVDNRLEMPLMWRDPDPRAVRFAALAIPQLLEA